jgi:hypothetical protein
VGEDVGVVAAGLLQGAGQDRQTVEGPLAVDRGGEGGDVRRQPGRIDGDGAEGPKQPASTAGRLPPGSWPSPWWQTSPREVAWDVDKYNLPDGEEVAAVLICVPGEQPIDVGTP